MFTCATPRLSCPREMGGNDFMSISDRQSKQLLFGFVKISCYINVFNNTRDHIMTYNI